MGIDNQRRLVGTPGYKVMLELELSFLDHSLCEI